MHQGPPCGNSGIETGHPLAVHFEHEGPDDPLLLQYATQVLAMIDQHENVVAKVKNLLRLQLSEALPRKETIASQLNMTARTLQRRLRDH